VADDTTYQIVDKVDAESGGSSSSFYEGPVATDSTPVTDDTEFVVVDASEEAPGTSSSFYKNNTIYDALVYADDNLASVQANAAAAAASAAAAAASEAAAQSSENDAETAQAASEAARNAAQTAQAAAELAETHAETAQAAAEAAQAAAAASAADAQSSENDAETAQGLAETARNAAIVAQGLAEAAQAAAETARNAAQLAETNAETAETNAETAETNAETAATNASTSATNAANSASAAATSATNASTSATNAANSATAADASADAADISEANAASSASAAATSATNAQAALDSFEGVYYGAFASDPTTDPNGNARNAGDLYWNTTASELRAFNGTTWVAYSPSGGAPTAAEYLVGSAHAGLSAERVVTNTSSITWDLGTAGQAKANYVPRSGAVVQSAFTSYNTYNAISGVIPFDDTIPQITEGGGIMTVSITPTSASNKLRIRALVCAQSGNITDQWGVIALFRDSTANALAAAASGMSNQAFAVTMIPLEWEVVAGSTASTDFHIRVGPRATGTIYVNGHQVSRFLGGAVKCTLVVEEIQA